MKFKQIISLFFLIITILFLTVADVYAAESSSYSVTEKKNILIINSYHQDFPWTKNIMSGLIKELGNSEYEINYYIEYLDAKRYDFPHYYKALKEIFQEKYNKTTVKIDAIILTDNNAFDFYNNFSDEIFYEKNIPVVFCGVNNFNDNMIFNRQIMTGVSEDIDIKGTLDLAFKIHSKYDTIAVISDNSLTGKINYQLFKNIEAEFSANKKIIHLNNLSYEELEEKLKSIDGKTIILQLSFYLDKNNKALSLEQSRDIIRSNTKAPVYSAWDFVIGYGIVGGMVVDGYLQGEKSGELVNLILQGTSPANIPIVRKSPNSIMFDYSELNRLDINISTLPANRKIINRPVSFYEKYKYLINLVLIIFSILILFLATSLFINLYRKNLIKSLIDSENRYKILLNSVTDYIYTVKIEGGRTISTYHSPGCIGVTGYSPEEYKKDTSLWYKMIHPDDIPIVNNLMTSILVNSQSDPIIHRIYHKDGSVHWVRNTTVVHKTADGTVYCFDGLIKDITETMITEEKLRESEERFSIFMNYLPAAVFIKDVDFKTVYMNKYMEKLFGLNEWVGKTAYDFVPSDIAEKMLSDDKVVMEKGFVNSIENIIDSQNHELVFETTKFIIPRKNKYPLIGGISVDITERKKNENEIIILNEILKNNIQKLEISNKDLEAFNYTISHDLRGMALSINGFSNQFLKKYSSALSDEAKHFIEIIKEDSCKMEELITELLNFSRVDFIDIDHEKVCMNDLVNSIFSALVTNEERKIHFKIGDLPDACGNKVMLRQVVTNLISNSIKYTSDEINAVIEISGQHDEIGNKNIYQIKDNGIGFDMSQNENLFKKFQRLNNSSKFTGTGLGLSIVKKIIEKHGGEVWGCGELNKGAEFFFTLPCRKDS